MQIATVSKSAETTGCFAIRKRFGSGLPPVPHKVTVTSTLMITVGTLGWRRYIIAFYVRLHRDAELIFRSVGSLPFNLRDHGTLGYSTLLTHGYLMCRRLYLIVKPNWLWAVNQIKSPSFEVCYFEARQAHHPTKAPFPNSRMVHASLLV